ncbi:potassium channel family protein [Ramlibacter tataouinensis]|uniref:Potassium ion channel-like protein n=1 Tax=Ramlibacter tataouinensis (strain ATCC BAA-407 / DSM 14655 / LMG 21543 / TTB310) TaxID=365046 RepID=F5Y511_RAMTT|nr:potassium channel family protein [Ramlibacter tataouinensis]AEG93851.1 potassium ion channel-like protein [Ramlibacter tataouinensis TTB310]
MQDLNLDIRCQRSSLLRRLEAGLEGPMAVLGLVWLVLVALDLAGHSHRGLELAGHLIWAVFVLDFAVKLVLAPDKPRFLRRNLLTLVSLALPALRGLRVLRSLRLLRAARATRGLRLLRLLTSLNRGMRSLAATLRRRGFGYVMLLTLVVLVAGAAGILAFEGGTGGPGEGLRSYGDALWWTAMLLVTMGSDYWPRTPEGRLLCLVLATYGFTIFGYVTATLATFFVASEAGAPAQPSSGRMPPSRT